MKFTFSKDGTNLKDVITQTNYYITALDICAISELYNIPTILTCRTPIPYLAVNNIAFTSKIQSGNCFIILSSSYKGVNSKNGLIFGNISKNETPLLNIAELGETYNQLTTNNIESVAEYLAFSKEQYKTTVIKRGKRKIVVNSSNRSKKTTTLKVKKMGAKIKVVKPIKP